MIIWALRFSSDRHSPPGATFSDRRLHYTGTLGSLLIHAIFVDDERDGRMLESADDDSLKYVVHVSVRAVYE